MQKQKTPVAAQAFFFVTEFRGNEGAFFEHLALFSYLLLVC
jgi:hypothetical protein